MAVGISGGYHTVYALWIAFTDPCNQNLALERAEYYEPALDWLVAGQHLHDICLAMVSAFLYKKTNRSR